MYRYYSTQRPLDIGTCPAEGLIRIRNMAEKSYDEKADRVIWGYAEYSRELDEEEVAEYELSPAHWTKWVAVIYSERANGNMTARIAEAKEKKEKPKDTKITRKDMIIRKKWFASREEAEKFIKQVLSEKS